MHTTRRKDGWYIEEIPQAPDCGPYSTRAEAEDIQRGFERFARWGHLRPFWTSEPESCKEVRR